MICNMIYVAKNVTSLDLDLSSKSDIDLLRLTCTCFDAFRREEYDAAKIVFLASLIQKLFVKKHLSKKSVILIFIDLYSLNR